MNTAHVSNLPFTDILLAITDLLGTRRAILSQTQAGKLYLPALEARQREAQDLPAWLREDRPFADALANTDIVHDRGERAILDFLAAYFEAPNSSPETLARIERIQAVMGFAASDTRQRYAVEAQRAQDRAIKLAPIEADLRAFPTCDGTLLDWVNTYLQAGAALDKLLGERANEPLRTRASALRIELASLVGRLRSTLRDEVAIDPALPRDLDTQLFAYFDSLASAYADRRAKPSTSPQPA